MRVKADLLETYVAEHLLAELAKPEVHSRVEAARDKVLMEAAELRALVDADRARQGDLGADYARREISRESFRTADRELSKRIEDSLVQVRRLEQVKLTPLAGVPDLVRWWKHAPLASQKGLAVLMLQQVVVYPASSRGSRTVDSDRVALDWRSWGQAAA